MKGDLIIWPDEMLAVPSVEVNPLDINPIFLDKMFKVMYANKGVGLSAIQLGVPLRIFVMDVSTDKSGSMVCINPVIKEFIGPTEEMNEGCLSFPGIFEKVIRFPEVIFECENFKGEKNTYQVAGTESQCVQHEIDHLNGKTMADSWLRVKKDIVKRKIKKALAGK